MEPDRFDDVEFRVLESPEPPPRPPRRRRRHGRWAIAAAVSVVTAGALAAGASALTDKAEAPTKAPGLTRSQERGAQGFTRHECHRGKLGHRRDQGFDDAARY